METGDPPTGWTTDTSNCTVASDADAYEGSAACLLTGTAATWAGTRHSLSTTAYTWHRLSAYIKNTNWGLARIFILGSGAYASSAVAPAGGYTLRTLVERTGSGTTPGFEIGGHTGGVGNVARWDNAVCEPLITNTLFNTVSVGTANVFISADLTYNVGIPIGLVMNLDSTSSPANYVLSYFEYDGTQYITTDECVAGVYTTKGQTNITYGAGYKMAAVRDGTSTRVWYNNAAVGSAMTMTANTNTRHGIFSTDSGNGTHDNFVCYARGNEGQYDYLNLFAE
jgi:hypothetical protein